MFGAYRNLCQHNYKDVYNITMNLVLYCDCWAGGGGGVVTYRQSRWTYAAQFTHKSGFKVIYSLAISS
jgi:hypothetical protein